jgi:tetratricopeptide (TPR) repeat protein
MPAPDAIHTLFEQGVRLHQSGDFGNAEQCYQQVLAVQPNHADALHLLGMIAHQFGQHQPAMELIERAIKINKKSPVYCANLGLVYQAQGQFKDAEKWYRKALAIKPDYADAHHNLAAALHAQSRTKDAEASFRRAVALKPKYVEAWINFGNFLHQAQRYQEAEACFNKALEINPEFVAVYYNLAHCLREQKNYDGAIAAYRRLLDRQPDHSDARFFLALSQAERGDAEGAAASYRELLAQDPQHVLALNNLGNALMTLQKWADAEQAYRTCLSVQPAFAQAHYNLGNLLAELERYAEAEACYREALRLNPQYFEALCGLGMVFKAQHKLDDACGYLQQAIGLRPDSSDAHMNYAMTLLLNGNLQEGWKEYEWRLVHHPELSRAFPYPVWRGENLAGKTILVWGERGFGDEIQFVRYLPSLKAMGARVVFECREELYDLFAMANLCDSLIVRKLNAEITERIDYQIPLLSVLARLNAKENTDTCPPNYLTADPRLIQQWKDRLQEDSAYRVGLVWAGNPQHKNDHNRSASLALYRPFTSVAGCSFYSLQKGSDEAAAAQMGIIDYSSELHSFSDTAALISNLDLVICVDTSVAHLAGALGKNVWLLLPFDPDWRWGLRSEQTVWYPGMTMFRQTAPRDWNALIALVKTALEGAVK